MGMGMELGLPRGVYSFVTSLGAVVPLVGWSGGLGPTLWGWGFPMGFIPLCPPLGGSGPVGGMVRRSRTSPMGMELPHGIHSSAPWWQWPLGGMVILMAMVPLLGW